MTYRTPHQCLLRELSSAMALGGMAMQAGGGIYGGIAARNSAEFNSRMAERDADNARIEADYRAKRIRDRTLRIIGAGRATAGASGITFEGSPAEVEKDNVTQGMLDELAVIRSGEARARQYQSEAILSRRRGRDAFAGGLLSTGGRAMNSASRIDWGA